MFLTETFSAYLELAHFFNFKGRPTFLIMGKWGSLKNTPTTVPIVAKKQKVTKSFFIESIYET